MVPPNARVRLELDRAEYFLGENVLVHFHQENSGGAAFKAEFGGDYRGAARALRFKVTGTDDTGKAIADPYPDSFCMGGMGGEVEITEKNSFTKSLAINRYLRFDQPGNYTIRVSHDFGWSEDSKKPFPAATIEITFKQPSEQQAAKLVETWLAAEEYSGSSWGKKSEQYSDFSQIRNIAFLPALKIAAEAGELRAIDGIGSIPHPDATAVLINLVDAGNANNADGNARADAQKSACRQLSQRLPDPYLVGQLPKRNVFEDGREGRRRWLVKQSWREEFVPEVRRLAAKFLGDSDKGWVATGAYFTECVGTPDDAAAIKAALNREIAKTVNLRLRTDIYPRPRGACMELQRAAKVLLNRGVEAPTDASTAADAILFLLALRTDDDFRPNGWLDICDNLLQHDFAYVQEQTLKSLPHPMPKSLRHHLARIVRGPDVDSAIEACHIVERDKLTEFKDAVLAVLKTATEDWLFNGADNACRAVAGNYERLEILVSRIDDEGMMFKCLDAMKSMYSNAGGGGHNSNIDLRAAAVKIKPMWEAFIRRHEQDLRAGRKFHLPHEEITPDMVPQHYSITLRDKGGSWPPRTK